MLNVDRTTTARSIKKLEQNQRLQKSDSLDGLVNDLINIFDFRRNSAWSSTKDRWETLGILVKIIAELFWDQSWNSEG